MEERIESSGSKIIRIAITGPECTGKSVLAAELADYFKTQFVPEYARDYVTRLERPYQYEDVVHIAETQRRQLYASYPGAHKLIFFDTDLIITKVWFDVVYGHYPSWIDRELEKSTIGLYLLCAADIPWIPDQVRENGGEMRDKLYLRYKTELDRYGYSYAVISGSGQHRINNAIRKVLDFLPEISDV